MKLSIIVPAYNEIDTIGSLIEAVRTSGLSDVELIVVDDASSDGTTELLRETLHERIDIVCYHDVNQGKGAALRTGIQAAGGTHIVFQDADLEYDPKELHHLVEALESADADVAYGSRFLGRGMTEVSPLWHRCVNGFLTKVSNLLTSYRLTDMETCYKLFPASFLKSISIQENKFGIEPELTAKAAASGLRIVEVPISYDRRTFEEGKKIGAKDGVRALYSIVKYGMDGAL